MSDKPPLDYAPLGRRRKSRNSDPPGLVIAFALVYAVLVLLLVAVYFWSHWDLGV